MEHQSKTSIPLPGVIVLLSYASRIGDTYFPTSRRAHRNFQSTNVYPAAIPWIAHVLIPEHLKRTKFPKHQLAIGEAGRLIPDLPTY